ncbi:hypothetical protein FACS1894199_09790 [Bacteroidia bacterium]|nr:hypothetical protein FACS1894199_09790 [Bacteroidia bacterium]
MNILFEYSFGWFFPIIGLSFFVAWRKYKKVAALKSVGKWEILLIAGLRFLTVFLLLFLLLKPALSFYRNIREKPLLIIAQDNSMSLLNTVDSTFFKNEYQSFLEQKLSALSAKFDVERLTFGKNVSRVDADSRIDFREHYTNISGVFTYIDENYRRQRPVGVVLLSDGIYNTGVNPRYKLNNYPVYTVVLGDTMEYPDVFIKDALVDKFNFLHTLFPVKVEIAATKQKGKTFKCLLRDNERVIGSKDIFIDKDNFLHETVFEVEARQKGVRKYSVEIQTNFTELSRENNATVIYTNILDNSGEIRIYYTAPHPDIAAITSAIKITGIYKYTKKPIREFSNSEANSTEPHLLILHNPLRSDPHVQKMEEAALKRKIPLWYILTERDNMISFAIAGSTGNMSNIGDYSVNLNTTTTTTTTATVTEGVTPGFVRNFPYFEFSEAEIQGFSKYPPVVVPFGEIRSNSGKNLFVQRIKNIDTDNALMSFYDKNGVKAAYMWGEGFWRWRLFSYRENGSHELFNTLIHKTVNYLITRRGNDRFIHDIRPIYDETEEAILNVELYNESYELVNTPDVSLQLKANGKEFNYILNRNGNKYRINLGNLATGEYHYTLKTNLKGTDFEKKGGFFVRTQNPELNDMVADKALMKDLAATSGGRTSDLKGLDELLDAVNSGSTHKVSERREVSYMELGELWWLGMLLLLLVCVEWALLKYRVE